MANKILDTLLKEYERKRIQAELDLENRKEKLYSSIPRLQEIEIELNTYAISMAKQLLKSSEASLESFQHKIKTLKKEKENLLHIHNLDSSFLKPFYDCAKCRDTGYISDENYKTNMCNCLKQKILDISYNKSNISSLNKENFSTFSEHVFSDDVDISKYGYNISPRKNILKIKEKSIDFINNFENPEQKNLLFTGNTGLRKNIYINLHCK